MTNQYVFRAVTLNSKGKPTHKALEIIVTGSSPAEALAHLKTTVYPPYTLRATYLRKYK